MAKHAHVPTNTIEDFQLRYFAQFPCIGRYENPQRGIKNKDPRPHWHGRVVEAIETTGTITTLFGRRRMFFGRGKDAATHRKAIAYAPQSMTGEQIDRGLLRVWRKYPQVHLLNQVHDSVLFQVPNSEKEELIPKILKLMKVELELAGGRKFSVPLEAAGGWNWGYAETWTKADWEAGKCREDRIGQLRKNIYGLVKWTGKEDRDSPSPRNRLRDYLKGPIS